MMIPPDIETREYQSRVINRTIKAVDEGHQNILIVAPTGSGKTIMGHVIALNLYHIYGYNTGWSAMRKHLWHQAAKENQSLIHFDGVQYFSMFDKNPPKCDVLISDEAQHTAAESAIVLQNKVKPKIHIGLSATPIRVDRMKLCFSKTIRDAGIRQLIDQGYLAPYHHYVFNDIWQPEIVAKIYLDNIDRWGKTIGYFLTVNECNICASIIRKSGIKCEVVSADSDQESQIEAFINGKVPILLNVNILTEGFNDPELRTVMVRDGSKGPTIQMAGRSLRPKPSGIPKHAQIVQSGFTKCPFVSIASPEKRFSLDRNGWEDRDRVDSKIIKAIHNVLALTK